MIEILSISTSMNIAEKLQMIKILGSMNSQSPESNQENVKEDLILPMEAYNVYKTNYGKDVQFDTSAKNFCKYKIVVLSLRKVSTGHFYLPLHLNVDTFRQQQ